MRRDLPPPPATDPSSVAETGASAPTVPPPGPLPAAAGVDGDVDADSASAARATVGGLGEGELLARIIPRLGRVRGAIVGPGDDAAVLREAGPLVLSIDTLVEGHDFRILRANGVRTSGFDVGWKSAAQNLSDINAMGGTATSLVVSLTLPPATPVAWVEDCARGLAAAIQELHADACSVVGGDLGRGAELVITAAVTGALHGLTPVLRSGARAGDVLAVAGSLGRAAAGLAILEDGRPVTGFGPAADHLIATQLRPRPPLAAGPSAAAAGATAMLDISDGLVRDAGRIATASGVQLDLDPMVLRTYADPLRDVARLLGTDPMEWVLGGGEDHGLLAAFPPDALLPPGFTAVGSVRPGKPLVTLASQATALRGWDHFAH